MLTPRDRTLPSDGRWGRPIERRCCRTKSPGSFLACRNCRLATGYYHGARRTLACQFVTGHDMHLDDDVASHLSSLTKRTNHGAPRQNIWFFRYIFNFVVSHVIMGNLISISFWLFISFSTTRMSKALLKWQCNILWYE